MAIKTTIQAGDWNTASNWDSGVPGVDDDAVVNHNMTVDGTGATFNTLDNNATITLTANQTWTIKDGGSIDNAGGTITLSANNPNWTVTASTGASNWTWIIDSGTFTDGTGEHHFEYGTFTISDNFSGFNSGSYFIDEDFHFQSSAAGKYFDFFTECTFAAGKTITLSDGSNSFILRSRAKFTAEGSSGNEITFNGNGQNGHLSIYNNNGTYNVSIKYCNFTDSDTGFHLQRWNPTSGTLTFQNNNASSNSGNGFFLITLAGKDITVSDLTSYSNGASGLRCDGDSEITINDYTGYSNTFQGIWFFNTTEGINLNRQKLYSNTLDGIKLSGTAADYVQMTNILSYENTQDGILAGQAYSSGTNYIFNSTVADNGTGQAGDYGISVPSSTVEFNITNTIVYGSTYGIHAGSGTDPTVTYSNVFGATTSNYVNMTDPTGSNGNISQDPSFVDAAGDDYSLDTDSPCINAGTSTGAPADDIDGNTRPFPAGTNPDIGAYEEQTVGVTPVKLQTAIIVG